ncbi:MAG: SPOR domain-containing protein [Cellvibrionaceae bacterium]
MDDGLKQRLIGAVVLIAIAVLFLPTLFGTDGRRTVDLSTQVPPRPVVVAEPLELSIPQPPEDARQAKLLEENYDHNTLEPVTAPETEPAIETKIVLNSSAEATKTEPKPKPVVKPLPKPEPVLNSDGVPKGWSIQVASFSEVARAEATLKSLEKAGYPKSYIRSGRGPKGEVYRVFVGPKINKQQAESDQLAIDKALKVKSLLVKFQP